MLLSRCGLILGTLTMQVAMQCLSRLFAEGYLTLFPALAMDEYPGTILGERDFIDEQPAHLAGATAGVEEQRQERRIAQRGVGLSCGTKQAAKLLVGENLQDLL